MEHLLQLSTRLVANIRVDDPMPAICLAQESIDTLEDVTDLSELSTATSELQHESKTKVRLLFPRTLLAKLNRATSLWSGLKHASVTQTASMRLMIAMMKHMLY
jgi:hypothetical protein